MRVRPECIPCYLKQVLSTAKMVTDNPDRVQRALEVACQTIPGLNPESTPAENSTLVLWAAQTSLAESNPFKSKKMEINAELVKLLPEFANQVSNAHDPLYTALLFSVAGNVIDLGILPEYDLQEAIDQVFAVEFGINDYDEFVRYAQNARKILFLGDNAGEIVLDRLLVAELAKFAPVVYVVKGAPILNDATMEDATQVQMSDVAHVITNGSGYLGTVIKDVNTESIDHFKSADLIVSKGQANFETLDQVAGPLFFILRAKCACAAEELGVEHGEMVLKKSACFVPLAQV